MTQGWAAGQSGDCIGLIVQSWSSTQIVFTFGNEFSSYPPIQPSDSLEVEVQGATYTYSPSVTSLTVSGPLDSPTVTVAGTDLGTGAPNGTAVSCWSGNTGYTFGTSGLWMGDQTQGWTAGEDGDCIGLIVQSWSNTQIVFTIGNELSAFGGMQPGDALEVGVGGTTIDGSAPS